MNQLTGSADVSTVRRRGPATIAAAAAIRTETTIARPVFCRGTGLHGGQQVMLELRPARPGSGIVFHRLDLERERGRPAAIVARHHRVIETRLCTVLADAVDPALRVGTIEHLMAALAGGGIDNAVVAVDGPELPIGDGSALPFLDLLARAGRAGSDRPVRPIRVCRPVTVEDGEASASLLPHPSFALDVSIDFDAPAIGRQSLVLRDLGAASFRAELAPARTFTLRSEIECLHRAGLARGGSLDNAVVVDGDLVLNPGGLRMDDEFVRHKTLDVVGDLALAGAPLLGRFVAHRPGHALTNRLLRALFADGANWSRAATASVPARSRAA